MATGLYSKNTEISILKGGWSVKKGCKEPKDILPNDDGTYQIRLSVDANKSEIDDYGCEVNHRDQKTTLVAQWPKGEITLLGYAYYNWNFTDQSVFVPQRKQELHFK